MEERDAAGDQFGIERVHAALRAGKGRSLEALAEGLVQQVRAFGASQHLADDLTLVLVRRRGGL